MHLLRQAISCAAIYKPVSKSRRCYNSLKEFAAQEEESPLNILCDSCLCCQRKLSSCICRTGNRIAAEEQLEFQFLAGIAAEQIVRQTNATNVTLHPLVQAP